MGDLITLINSEAKPKLGIHSKPQSEPMHLVIGMRERLSGIDAPKWFQSHREGFLGINHGILLCDGACHQPCELPAGRLAGSEEDRLLIN